MSDVVLVYLSSVSEMWVLRTQSNIYNGVFFTIQRIKSKIFNWVLNKPLNLNHLTLIWIPASWTHLFKYFKNSLKNGTIWCLRLRRIQKILTSLFNNFLNYKTRQNCVEQNTEIKDKNKIGEGNKGLKSTFACF